MVEYPLYILRQTSCLVVNPIMHDGGSGLRLNDDFDIKLYLALANSVDIYSHGPSSSFRHSFKVDFYVSVMML